MDKKFKFQNAQEFENAFVNNGFVADSFGTVKRIKLHDAITAVDSPIWISQTITNVVRSAVEPRLVVANMFKKISLEPGTHIKMSNMMSTADIGSLDLAEDQKYPTLKLDAGGAEVFMTADKMGIQINIPQYLIKISQYDVVGMHIDAAARVMQRALEKKAVQTMMALGVVTHDNLAPSGSKFGVTTGRDVTGAANGTLTMDDLVEAFGVSMDSGFIPNTIVISPLIWTMWMKDPVLRTLAMSASSWYRRPEGNMGSVPWNDEPALGRTGRKEMDPDQTMPLVDATLAPKVPEYFPFPIRTIVSPFMPVTIASGGAKITSIALVDINEVGYNPVEEEINVDQNIDWDHDTVKIRIRTRQGFMVANEGLGIMHIKNVVVDSSSYFLSPMIQSNYALSGTATITRATPISL